jgi:ADP-ribose pyrophosphatase YjhB (NUDIX family)
VEHGEDPYDAVVREDTGYQVRVEQLLGVDSRTRRVEWDAGAVFQAMGIFYRIRITGGQLRHEVGGSTDLAAWIPVTEVPELERAASSRSACSCTAPGRRPDMSRRYRSRGCCGIS